MPTLVRLRTPLLGAALVVLTLPGTGAAQPADPLPVAVAPLAPVTLSAVMIQPPATPPIPPQATTPPPPPGAPDEDQDADAPPPPPAAPPPPGAPPAPGARRSVRPPQPRPANAESRRAERDVNYTSKGINIRIDATVTESRGEQVLGRKVISVTLVDGENGAVRSSAMVPINQSNDGPKAWPGDFQRVPLNMDAMVRLRDDNRVHARVTLDYNRGSVDIGESGAGRAARENFIRQSVSVILDNGRPLIVAQSADPEGDRRVTLELKATVLK
jgi:hypothetical protein